MLAAKERRILVFYRVKQSWLMRASQREAETGKHVKEAHQGIKCLKIGLLAVIF
jgi:hypothetical protein